jgi:hypothetical protein
VQITNFAPDDEDYWDQKTGLPTSAHFGNAVQVWAIAQDRPVTITDAALAFNVSPDLVRRAVEDHCWMMVGENDLIEHDGE